MKKTGEMKELAGYQCEKWTVRSDKEDRTLTYWVAADAFEFFIPLLETLNRKDEQAVLPGDTRCRWGLPHARRGTEAGRRRGEPPGGGKGDPRDRRPACSRSRPVYNRFERN